MKTIKKMFLAGLVVLFSVSAGASVIENLSERDWLSGDKALTYDRTTGLEWLDLNLTKGMSINQIYSSGILNIFRWATPSEIENILDAAIQGENTRFSNNLADNEKAFRWIKYLGITGAELELRWSHGYTIWTDVEKGNIPAFQYYGAIAMDCVVAIKNLGSCYDGHAGVIESAPLYANGLDMFTVFEEYRIVATSWGFTGPGGAMLVRKAQLIEATEPKVLTMFVLGVIGLVFSRTKKRQKING